MIGFKIRRMPVVATARRDSNPQPSDPQPRAGRPVSLPESESAGQGLRGVQLGRRSPVPSH